MDQHAPHSLHFGGAPVGYISAFRHTRSRLGGCTARHAARPHAPDCVSCMQYGTATAPRADQHPRSSCGAAAPGTLPWRSRVQAAPAASSHSSPATRKSSHAAAPLCTPLERTLHPSGSRETPSCRCALKGRSCLLATRTHAHTCTSTAPHKTPQPRSPFARGAIRRPCASIAISLSSRFKGSCRSTPSRV